MSPRSDWFRLNSPIGVIGAFAALVEIALIAASAFADGVYQWALIIFAAAAFFFISYNFFNILRHKNWVLYPPREYGGETQVATFVGAMSERAVAEGLPVRSPVLIYLAPRTSSSLSLPVEVTATVTVAQFLGHVGATLLPAIAFEDEVTTSRRYYLNYGVSWVLRGVDESAPILDLGPRWAWSSVHSVEDQRLVHQTSVQGKSALELHQIRDLPLTPEEIAQGNYQILSEVVRIEA